MPRPLIRRQAPIVTKVQPVPDDRPSTAKGEQRLEEYTYSPSSPSIFGKDKNQSDCTRPTGRNETLQMEGMEKAICRGSREGYRAKPKPEKRSTRKKTKKSPTVPAEPVNKRQLLTALKQEHPQTTLTVGTLKANIKASLRTNMDLANELVQLLNEAVTAANKVKRDGQRLIGLYLERMARVIQTNPARVVEPDDRQYLDGLCQRISKKKDGGDEDGGDEDDAPASSAFLGAFLRCLYSGNAPSDAGVGKLVAGFMKRLEDLRLYQPPPPERDRWVRHKTPFSPSDLLRSISTQLASELLKMYCHGTIEMQEKVIIYTCT